MRTYNGPDNLGFSVQAMAMDSTGNIIITGVTNRTSGRQDYCTVKYNTTGVQQWVAIYDGIPGSNGINSACTIGADSQGNIYITGTSERASFGSDDYCTIKYNSNGIQQWVARYNYQGGGASDAFALAIDNLGNVYVTGQSTGNNTGYDFATIKYSASGDSVWVERYDDPLHMDDHGNSIVVDTFGNVYVAGRSDYSGMLTIKYNSLGVQQWIAGSPHGSVYKIKLDYQNNVFVTGRTDFTTIKYSNSGVQQWLQNYISSTAMPYDLTIDKNQNIYVTGSIWGGSLYRYNYGTIKYNSTGVQQWVQIYNGPVNGDDVAYSISIDDSANVFISGASHGSTGNEICTIKYNSSGIQQWLIRYTSDGNAGGTAIITDRNRNVYVSGEGGNILGGILIKYSQIVPIKITETDIPKKFE